MKKGLLFCLLIVFLCMFMGCKQEAEKTMVGQRGPAGGYIFYDKGEYSDGWRYLEAAPYYVTYAGWGEDGYFSADGDGIGEGKINTEIIDSNYSFEYEKNAAAICLEYSLGGFDDWYLPNRTELDHLYDKLIRSGIIESYNFVWSSSAPFDSEKEAYGYAFGKNGSMWRKDRDEGAAVWPIRAY